MTRSPAINFFRQMVADCYHFSQDYGEMGEVCIECPSSSQIKRPFKFLVKNQTFTVDSEKLRILSPIFAVMCFGRDFEDGRELTREIVDEKSDDISTFLQCVQDSSSINEWNFPTLLRLATKYEVPSLINSCAEFIIKSDLSAVKADQILTLLIAADESRLRKEAIECLIIRLASEEKTVQTRLRLNRFLSASLYTTFLSTTHNIEHIRLIEQMNGHFFGIERNRIAQRKGLCALCKRIMDTSSCDGCGQSLCSTHWRERLCSSSFGTQMLTKLRTNLVEFNIEE